MSPARRGTFKIWWDSNSVSEWARASRKGEEIGFYALVWRGGRDVDDLGGSATWSPGLHWGVPWLKVAYLVSKQSVVFDHQIKHCVTRDNVPVRVRVSSVLRVLGDASKGEDTRLVRKFVYELGVRGLETQLVNALEEGIRVMTRSIPHEIVYSLASGGREDDNDDHHPSSSSEAAGSLPGDKRTDGIIGMRIGENIASGQQREIRRTVKRSRVAPETEHQQRGSNRSDAVDMSYPVPRAEPNGDSLAQATLSGHEMKIEVNTSEEIVHHVTAGESGLGIVPTTTNTVTPSPRLRTIHRGLRASRIFPHSGDAASCPELPSRSTQGIPDQMDITNKAHEGERLGTETASLPLRPRKRIIPLEGGGDEQRELHGCRSRGVARGPPPVSNLDLSPRASLSMSLGLPKLELDPRINTPLANLSRNCSPAQGPGNPKKANSGVPEEPRIDGPGLDAAEKTVSHATRVSNRRECSAPAGGEVNDSDKGTQDQSAGEAISIGRRLSGALQQRLNRTLNPQGIQVTAVMIRSTELPQAITQQMSNRTDSVSQNLEQRAVQRFQMQMVNEDNEVQEFLQRHEIERALEADEAERRLQRARVKLGQLKVLAEAAVARVAARAAVHAQRIAAECRRDVSRSHLREYAEGTTRRSSAESIAAVLEANADALQKRILAEADAKVSLVRAQSNEALHGAEGKAAPMLRAARTHCTLAKRLEVWSAFSGNTLAVVTPESLLGNANQSTLTTQRSWSLGSALIAMMLSEFSFGSHAFLKRSRDPRQRRERLGASLLSRSERLELETQLKFVRWGPNPFDVLIRVPDPTRFAVPARSPFRIGDDERANRQRGNNLRFEAAEGNDSSGLNQEAGGDGDRCRRDKLFGQRAGEAYIRPRTGTRDFNAHEVEQ